MFIGKRIGLKKALGRPNWDMASVHKVIDCSIEPCWWLQAIRLASLWLFKLVVRDIGWHASKTSTVAQIHSLPILLAILISTILPHMTFHSVFLKPLLNNWSFSLSFLSHFATYLVNLVHRANVVWQLRAIHIYLRLRIDDDWLIKSLSQRTWYISVKLASILLKIIS